MYKAILFDLDGTLLPMDNDEFTKGYLGMLSRAVAHLGYTPDTMIPAMWQGVAAMVKNDGSRRNCEVFWETFSRLVGKDVTADIPQFDAFYSGDFHKAIAFTQPTPNAKKAVSLARGAAERVVLATNPFFPPPAVYARLSWAGLSPDDFDLVTHYENSGSCKPNPYYYTEIAQKLGISPADCLMIGNNVDEDILAAKKAGMDTFLLTDCLIGDLTKAEVGVQGSFDKLLVFLNSL
ncbi:MAG: HAD family hydrolase [Clostridia bacterium]|nr:HAD family hydrolase [Clostridia bacterium]